MATLQVTKGNVNILVRRGVISGSVAKQVQQGATVSIEYQGNLQSSFRPQSMTVDGRTTSFGRSFEPERQRRSMTPRRKEGVPSKVTTRTPTSRIYPDDLPKPKPSFEREQFISTRDTATMSQADILKFTSPTPAPPPRGGLAGTDELTAGEIFDVAREKGIATEQLFSGRGVGFAPSPERIESARRDVERDLGNYNEQISKPIKEEPKGYRDRVFGKIEQLFQKARTAPTASDIITEKIGVQGFKFKVPGAKSPDVGKEILAGVVGGSLRFSKMVAYPKQTVKGFKELGVTAVSQPLEVSGKQVLSALHGHIKAEGLPYVIGEGIFEYYGAKGAGSVTKVAYAKSPIKIVVGKVKVPIKGGQLRTIWKGAGIEYFKRGQPLIGTSRKKIVLGTPKVGKIYLEAGGKKGYLPVSPMEARTIMKKLPEIYGPQEVAKIQKGLVVMRATEKTKSAFVKAQFNKQLKALSPRGVKEVLKFAEQEEGLVYGSFGARQQMPKSRIPGDIDLQLGVSQADAIVKTQELAKRLQKVGENVRISKKHPTLIEAVKGKEIHHAVDIHSIEQSLVGSSAGSEGVWGLSFGQKPVKIEGVKVMPLSEQGLRKGQGIFQLRAEGLGARPHRLKDIPDFFTTQEVLIESKWFGKTRLRKTLGELKELYPQEVFKDAAKNPIKVLLQAPKRTKTSTFFKPTRPSYTSPALGVIRTKPASPYLVPKVKGPSPKLPSAYKAPSVRSISKMISPGRLPSPKIPSRYTGPKKVPSPKIPSAYKGPSPYKGPKPPSPKIPSEYKIPSPYPYKVPSPSPRPYAYRSPSPYLYSFGFPTSPPPRLLFPGHKGILEEKMKKPRELERWFKYKPSIFAVGRGIKGKKPEVITGLEVRPLT